MRLYPALVERKAGRARLQSLLYKASQGSWLLAKDTLYPEGWLFVLRARGLSSESCTWTPSVLWSNNCTEKASIISYRTICVRHCLHITSSLLPLMLAGRNDDLHFIEEKNVASKGLIEDLNPGALATCGQVRWNWSGKKSETSDFIYFFSSVQFSHSVVFNSLRPHELQHARPPCPSPTPRVRPNSCPLSQ